MGLFAGTDLAIEADRIQEEVDLERMAVRQGVERYRSLVSGATHRGHGSTLRPVERLLAHWVSELVDSVEAEISDIRTGAPARGRSRYGHRLIQAGEPDVLAVVAMHTIMSGLLRYPDGISMTRLASAVGGEVNADQNIRWLSARDPRTAMFFRKRRKLMTVAQINAVGDRWPIQERIALGVALIYMLIGVASLGGWDESDFVPAIRVDMRRIAIKTVLWVSLTPAAFSLIHKSHAAREHLIPRYQPMIIPPLKWGPKQRGGYVQIRTPLVRKMMPWQAARVKNADLTLIHSALNAINSLPWRINTRVLDVMREMYASGGDVADIPRRGDIPVPAGASKWARRNIRKDNIELAGERSAFERRLEVAHRMRLRPRIFLPHRLDFRGRIYPEPLYLHHHSDHTARGLLLFADGKPLTDRGWYWLRVHAANTYGYDRVSFDERVRFADEMTSTMRQVARDPFVNETWHDADEPFQFLAACFEIDDAMKAANPADFVSNLPTHIDGTCSAIQHYTGISLCADDAPTVNMTPADEPSDWYSTIAESVADRCRDSSDEIAELVLPYIDRKTTKSYAMCQSYGVTHAGGRRMIMMRLNERGFPAENMWTAADFLTHRANDVFTDTACRGAMETMGWLKECARAITADAWAMAWTAPSGLPIIQPYREDKYTRLCTARHSLNIRTTSSINALNRTKQISAFAANYIHSIDASHLMFTARAAHENGIAVATVHDCFWCLPRDCDDLHRIARQNFHRLHRDGLARGLFDDFSRGFRSVQLPEPPALGTYDLGECLNADYMFS